MNHGESVVCEWWYVQRNRGGKGEKEGKWQKKETETERWRERHRDGETETDRDGDRDGETERCSGVILAESVQALVHVLGRGVGKALAAVCAGIGLLPCVDALVGSEVGGL